jgi:hypothetical protein
LGAEIGGFRAHSERGIANIDHLTLDQVMERSTPSTAPTTKCRFAPVRRMYTGQSPPVDAKLISFGLVEIDGRRFDRDVVLEAGNVRPRKEKPSKPQRDRYGHTPLSAAENIPWSASRLIVGTGASGQLPIRPLRPGRDEPPLGTLATDRGRRRSSAPVGSAAWVELLGYGGAEDTSALA